MVNLEFEIVFWLILLIYIFARATQNKKASKNNIKKIWSKELNNPIKVIKTFIN